MQLADPRFNHPGKIDILLGMDVYQSIVFPKILKVSSFITAQYTIFGWLLYGQADSGANVTAYLTLHSVSEDTSNQLLRAFWEVEEVHTPKDSYTNEEQLALVHYEKTTTKTRDGLYQVKFPRRPDAPVLGDSRKQAERRLASTELSLKRKEKWDCFREVINDYFTSGHAELVPNEDLKKPASSVFYLPMHGVTKQSSTSTKLRAVFDASAATSTGVSLNDILLPGPNVYSPLPDILLRFRLHKIGLTADVSKMFRMIELHRIDRDLHRFLWTTDSSHMVDCRMTRLTFGITSSPFIAAQTLQRIASDNAELYPQAAEVVQKNFYVDDCLTGAESVTEATELRAQLNGLLGQGNMQLRKWRSSSRSVIDSVPEDLREQEVVQELPTPNELHKALGIHWDTCRDSLHISTSSLKPSEELTKRNLTSDIARTFDVLGWIAPAILLLKLLLQRLWELQLAWDDPVPDSIATIWLSWRNQIPALAKRPIPRRYFSLDQDRLSVQLQAAVKSAKTLLKKTVGLHKFTYEELYTVITQVESCLNSRPLVPFDSTDEDGLDVLTPGHFLVGRPLEALPDKGDILQQPSTLKRWNLCQLVIREFWYRWSTEYIRTLNRLNKWRKINEDIQVGDIVLLKDSTTFQNSWPLGRIVKTYPGQDGLVRVVLVKTAKSLLRRPICKLVLLLKESDKAKQSPP